MERTKYGYAESSGLKSTIAGHIYSIQNDSLAISTGNLFSYKASKGRQGCISSLGSVCI